jgi:KaiC/GvpD/RAD55 family RecA-like ATPase
MTKVISQSLRSRKRVLVTFDEDQVKIIKSLKGFGTKDAEIVRSIVIAYLSEHNYIKQASIDRDLATEESNRAIRQASDELDRKYRLARARGNF